MIMENTKAIESLFWVVARLLEQKIFDLDGCVR